MNDPNNVAIPKNNNRAEVSCQFTANSPAANSLLRSMLPIRFFLEIDKSLSAFEKITLHLC